MSNKSNLFLIGGVILILLIFAGIIYLVSANETEQKESMLKTYSRTDESIPKISLKEKSFDFGTINGSAGEVSHDFVVENKGTETLQVYDFLTSCMCTTAYVKKDGERISKKFGMHNIGTWTGEVEPGKKISVEIIFDPNYHKNTSGPVQRTLSFKTNDPTKEKASLSISANVE